MTEPDPRQVIADLATSRSRVRKALLHARRTMDTLNGRSAHLKIELSETIQAKRVLRLEIATHVALGTALGIPQNELARDLGCSREHIRQMLQEHPEKL